MFKLKLLQIKLCYDEYLSEFKTNTFEITMVHVSVVVKNYSHKIENTVVFWNFQQVIIK